MSTPTGKYAGKTEALALLELQTYIENNRAELLPWTDGTNTVSEKWKNFYRGARWALSKMQDKIELDSKVISEWGATETIDTPPENPTDATYPQGWENLSITTDEIQVSPEVAASLESLRNSPDGQAAEEDERDANRALRGREGSFSTFLRTVDEQTNKLTLAGDEYVTRAEFRAVVDNIITAFNIHTHPSLGEPGYPPSPGITQDWSQS